MKIARFLTAENLPTCYCIAQVIAFVCGIIVIALMLMTLMSSDWLVAEGWRQGLFSHCIGENAPTPLPFNVPEREVACYPARDEGLFLKIVNVY